MEPAVVIPPSPDASDSENQSGALMSADGPASTVGGTIESPSVALIAGVFVNPKKPAAKTLKSIPLTRLPATLGRSHDTEDESFYGLGHHKALSRQQCRIFYMNKFGGKLSFINDSDKEEPFYHPPTSKTKKIKVIQPNPSDPLPEGGFFAIECLGKNRISVDRQPVGTGETALLKSGSKIRMSTYYLCFLLPEDAVADPATMEVPNPNFKKKRPKPTFSGKQPVVKKAKTTPKTNLMDEAQVKELLQTFSTAIEKGEWGHPQKQWGTQLTVCAVQAATRNPEFRSVDGGVGRKEIIDWISESSLFGEWYTQMSSKVTVSSFQSKISKALLDIGCERSGNAAHLKWIFPPLQEADDNKKKASPKPDGEATKMEETDKPDAPEEKGKEEEEEEEEDDDEEEQKGENEGVEEKEDDENEEAENDEEDDEEENGEDDDSAPAMEDEASPENDGASAKEEDEDSDEDSAPPKGDDAPSEANEGDKDEQEESEQGEEVDAPADADQGDEEQEGNEAQSVGKDANIEGADDTSI